MSALFSIFNRLFKISDGGSLQRLQRLWLVMRPQWRLFSAAGLCALLAIPMSLAEPLVTRVIFDEAIPQRDLALLGKLSLFLLGLALVREVFSFLEGYLLTIFHNRVTFSLRVKLFAHLQQLSLSYYADRETGYIMSRQTDDLNNLSGIMADSFIGAVIDLAKLVIFVGMLFYIDPVLAGSGLVFVLFVFGLNYLYARPMRQRSEAAQETWSEVSASLHEGIAGIALIQATARERYERRHFVRSLVGSIRASFRRDLLRMFSRRTSMLVNHLGMFLIIFVGAYRIIEDASTIGDFFAFYMYLGRVFGATSGLTELNPQLQSGLAALERIYEVLDTEPKVKNKPDAKPLPHVEGVIAFEEVDFAYNEGEPVLESIDLQVQSGEVVALVGPSGAGKSTFVNLIPRFYDPQQGKITIDGTDLRQLNLQDLRRHIGTVPQDVFLFNRSVLENIRYGKPDADRDQIVRAAKAANAHDFIEAFSEGYDSLIGERGVKLSGGQKQRLAIAREVLRAPAILILDEATSSLDSASEQLIQEALERLKKNRTSFVIAHRLSTVINADTILVFDQGRIVERGTHGQLLQQDGLYKLLYRTQFQNHGRPERQIDP